MRGAATAALLLGNIQPLVQLEIWENQGSEVKMCKTNTASTATDLKKSLFQTLDPFIVPRNPVMQSQHLTNQSIPTQLSQDLAQVAIHEGVSSAILNSDCLLRRDKMLLYSRPRGSLPKAQIKVSSPCPPKFHFLGVVLPNTCLKSLKHRS